MGDYNTYHTLETGAGDGDQGYSFARLDDDRLARQGFPEVVYCQGKVVEHLVEIYKNLYEKNGCVFGTRATEDQARAVIEALPEATYDKVSRVLKVGKFRGPRKAKAGDAGAGEAVGSAGELMDGANEEVGSAGAMNDGANEADTDELLGNIVIASGGTSDIPVCEEAAQTAEFFGSKVTRVYDIGVSGIDRLLSKKDVIRSANVVIVVAGMEGALASVIGGLVSVPVIAVPTSVGYGACFEGLSALLTMINTCANGVTVVNIDNGYGAGYVATQINRLAEGVKV